MNNVKRIKTAKCDIHKKLVRMLGEKNLVVSFFVTWCVPYAKEIPELIKMSKELGDGFLFMFAGIICWPETLPPWRN